MMDNADHLDLTELSADLVAAYVSNNRLSPQELPGLLAQVHGAFANLTNGTSAQVEETSVAKLTPAQIRRSITPDALISFVDGKPYKMLKRHLDTHGMSFDDYRQRYGLPVDYPTVAASYSAMRSASAKSLGLGNRGYLAQKEAAVEVAPVEKPKRAARSRKTDGPV